MYILYLYTEDAALKELYLQRSGPTGDAGVDLYTPQPLVGLQGTVFINHQIRCRMVLRHPNGEETPVSYYLYPRSSLAKTRLRLANSVGIIDSGYRGEIIAAMDVKPLLDVCVAAYTGEKVDLHQRLVQLCSPTLDPIHLTVVDSLEQMDLHTQRGDGGFGSTGR